MTWIAATAVVVVVGIVVARAPKEDTMSSTPAKILYRPVGLVSGIVGGIIAGALFKQVWKRIGHEEDPPGALQSEYSWATCSSPPRCRAQSSRSSRP